MRRCRRKHNPSHIREKHCYTIEEVAALLGAHKNTIRQWVKQGLACIDDARPHLIHGADLKAFIVKKQRQAKKPCGIGEIFCFRCRASRKPCEEMVDVTFLNQKAVQLTGICSVCAGKLNRRSSLAKLPDLAKSFQIQQLINSSIIACLPPSLECYLSKEN